MAANLRNIEIKARFLNQIQFDAAVEVAKKLSGNEKGELITKI